MSNGYDIVAGPMPTKYGAKSCRECKEPIPVGCMVVKIATQGKTTQHGQGPGYWIHAFHKDERAPT